MVAGDRRDWLEIDWYADDSPAAGPFHEGEELDHLGFEVGDFEGVLQQLRDAGCPPAIGSLKADNWNVAFVKGVDGVWLDIYRINLKTKKSKAKARTKKRCVIGSSFVTGASGTLTTYFEWGNYCGIRHMLDPDCIMIQ